MSFFMRLLHSCSVPWYQNSRQARYSVMYSGVQIQYHDDKTASAVSTQRRSLKDKTSDSDPLALEIAGSVHSALQSCAHTSSSHSSSSWQGSVLYVINCSPVQSAYKARDLLPVNLSFSFKHSANCVFTHIDTCAIPLLGYLPQDIVGTSIFQYYHPDDLGILLTAYKGLTMKSGKSVCGQPVRFKVKNGEYILVDTELSCFINPWSHRFDFVIGKHSVLR